MLASHDAKRRAHSSGVYSTRESACSAPPLVWAVLSVRFEPTTSTDDPLVTIIAAPDRAQLSRMVHSMRVKRAASTISAPATWPLSKVRVSSTCPPTIMTALSPTDESSHRMASLVLLESVPTLPRSCGRRNGATRQSCACKRDGQLWRVVASFGVMARGSERYTALWWQLDTCELIMWMVPPVTRIAPWPSRE